MAGAAVALLSVVAATAVTALPPAHLTTWYISNCVSAQSMSGALAKHQTAHQQSVCPSKPGTALAMHHRLVFFAQSAHNFK